MSGPPGGSRGRLADVVDERPLRGGLIGIALVALATLGLVVAAAVVVGVVLLVAG